MPRTFALGALVALGFALFAACADEAPPIDGIDASAPDGTATTIDAGDGDVRIATDGPSDAAAPLVRVTLERRDATVGDADAALSPSPFAVLVDVRGSNGGVVANVTVTVDVAAQNGTVSTPRVVDAGLLEITVTPSIPSGELPLTVHVRAPSSAGQPERELAVVTKTALILPLIGPAWGQPEGVDGLVNTEGYEDGVVISPDGEWLFVSSYSPVDAICCLVGCGAPKGPFSAACQTALGPYGAPERPGMFGAERIVSPTRILNRCDKFCFAGADGGELEAFALPPVTAFGFHRQPDGSFAEPFVIGIDGDGCGAPFGYSLIASPTGTSAEAVFAANSLGGATGTDLFYAPLTLGAPNVLARMSCEAGTSRTSDVKATRLALTPLAGEQGNPQFRAPYMFFDDDNGSNPPTMFVAKASGSLPDASFTATAPLPVGSPAEDRRQPFLLGSTLYFASILRVATATLNGDPMDASSWSTPTVVLAGETTPRTGAVISLGQPTVAQRPGAPNELYFVYGLKTATGLNLQAGRVRAR